jgi:hypothetical protein
MNLKVNVAAQEQRRAAVSQVVQGHLGQPGAALGTDGLPLFTELRKNTKYFADRLLRTAAGQGYFTLRMMPGSVSSSSSLR